MSNAGVGDGSSMREALKHAVLILGALIVIVPFYVMLSYSLKSQRDIETNSGGFIGSQAPVVDEYCVKLGNPRADLQISAQRTRLEVFDRQAHFIA